MTSSFYPPDPSLAFHPYLPHRLGYSKVLSLVNPKVARLIGLTKPFALMSGRNLTTIYREGRAVLRRGVPGAFVELGVHRGGSAGILAHLLLDRPERHLHLFDRWGDLPDPTEEDGPRAEEYRRDAIPDKLASLRDDPPLDAARELIEQILHFPRERVHYHSGWYQDTLPAYSGGPIAFASLDCDYYESVKLGLELLDAHASPGATVIADDYAAWPGARRAVHEWIDRTSRKVRLHALGTGPAILWLD